ncbi:unnamed protein product [Protopolystoma xenopodis]|uniref:Uncharacterized protein n=1 Tax=Protopolystoma xenopodis TaxID=117903 RepID=A0A3S5BDB4_9PLAT|nr:unnamed protein product [Protopolystoma xenopodis]
MKDRSANQLCMRAMPRLKDICLFASIIKPSQSNAGMPASIVALITFALASNSAWVLWAQTTSYRFILFVILIGWRAPTGRPVRFKSPPVSRALRSTGPADVGSIALLPRLTSCLCSLGQEAAHSAFGRDGSCSPDRGTSEHNATRNLVRLEVPTTAETYCKY